MPDQVTVWRCPDCGRIETKPPLLDPALSCRTQRPMEQVEALPLGTSDRIKTLELQAKAIVIGPHGETELLPAGTSARLRQAEERLHRLYECRLEPDKWLCMVEHYEQDRKREARKEEGK